MDKLERILQNNQENSPFSVVFPGSTSEVPKWFDCWKDFIGNENGPCNSYQFSIKISENLKWEKLGLAICAISEGGKPCYCDYEVSINKVCIRPFGGLWTSQSKRFNSTSDHVWLQYIPLPVERKADVDQKGCSSLPPYYRCTVRFHFPGRRRKRKSKSYGVHLVCQQSKVDEHSSTKGVVEPMIPVVERSNYLDGAGVIW
ncbi:hypothetical protein M0R45_036549 [Rubus argutus]|uniref:Uncharacterized protein n=1 Tax=Rubus argutus TaxID=59490 RepID=A0AAW1VWD9_RUBAR